MTSSRWAHGTSDVVYLLGALAFAWSGVFASHFARYVLSCGIVELACAHVPALRRAQLRSFKPDDAQRRMEFRSSLKAGVIFAIQFLPLVYAVRKGATLLYFDVDRFGRGYLVVSFVLVLILHDAYFYWTHRLMHHPRLFRAVHLHHHRSRAPTAWAAFSFHPWESVVQGGIHLLVPLVIPIHFSVLGMFVVWTNIYAAILHSGHDVLGTRVHGQSIRARFLNTSIDHDLHHGGVAGNYALYFSFWDRLMGTHVDAASLQPAVLGNAIEGESTNALCDSP